MFATHSRGGTSPPATAAEGRGPRPAVPSPRKSRVGDAAGRPPAREPDQQRAASRPSPDGHRGGGAAVTLPREGSRAPRPRSGRRAAAGPRAWPRPLGRAGGVFRGESCRRGRGTRRRPWWPRARGHGAPRLSRARGGSVGHANALTG